MFDIPPAIETYCGTEVAEIVQYVDPSSSYNRPKILDIYSLIKNSNIANSCQDSLMNHFMTLINGQQSDEYINAILPHAIFATAHTSVYPKTITLIKEIIPSIKYQPTAHFAAEYFTLLIFLNYPITANIKELNVNNDTEQLWYKNLYLAHNNDLDAITYLQTHMQTIKPAPELLNKIRTLLKIKKSVRDPLLSDFTEDTRILYGVKPEYARTLGDQVQSFLKFN